MASTIVQTQHTFRPPSTLPPSISLSQNTAAVHEHRCLYTHDLRRKAKRWQDGFVKFHTFNKRVMLYDVPRNFIGGMHFQEASPDGLGDGDELTLDGSGVLIQVAERVGTAQTDLSGLLTKKPQNQEATLNQPPNHVQPRPQLQPRTSNIVSRPPNEWTGRARLPAKSPFELRQRAAQNADVGGERPRKKQRRDDEDHIPLSELLRAHNPTNSGLQPSNLDTTPPRPSPTNNKANTRNSAAKTTSPSQQRSRADKRASGQQSVSTNARGGTNLTTSANHAHTEKRGRRDIPERQTSVASRPKQNESHSKQGKGKQPTIGLGNVDISCDLPIDETRGSSSEFMTIEEAEVQLNDIPSRPIASERSRRKQVGGTAITESSMQGVPPSVSKQDYSVQAPPRQPSPPVSTTNHLAVPVNEINLSIRSSSSQVTSEDGDGSKKRKTKSIRLASQGPRKRLLCQNMPSNNVRKEKNSHNKSERWDSAPEFISHLVKNQSPTSTRKFQDPVVSGRDDDLTRQQPKVLVPNTQPQDTDAPSPDLSVSLDGCRESPKFSPRRTSEKRSNPPLQRQSSKDYSHLDAQIFHKPSTTASPPDCSPHLDPEASVTRNAPPTVSPKVPPPQLFPPQRGNHTAPREPAAPESPPPEAAEPPTTRAKGGRQANPKFAPPRILRPACDAQPSAVAAAAARAEVCDDPEMGPWSREAWDLFGLCPVGKQEALGWRYEGA